ncbi:MAG TPA: hypothetical protein VIV58_06170 [Kofleriaceae bacterium]
MFRLALAVTVSLGLFGPGLEARADGKVDWSQYIEKPGDKPPPVSHAPAAEPVASKTPAKKPAKKPPVKSTKKPARKHK